MFLALLTTLHKWRIAPLTITIPESRESITPGEKWLYEHNADCAFTSMQQKLQMNRQFQLPKATFPLHHFQWLSIKGTVHIVQRQQQEAENSQEANVREHLLHGASQQTARGSQA